MTKTKPRPSKRKKPDIQSKREGSGQIFTVEQRSDFSSFCKWVIPNFSTVKTGELFSPSFPLGGSHFRLLFHPKGTPGLEPVYVSLGLEINELRDFKMGRFASFKLTLVNHLEDSKSVHWELCHRFSENNTVRKTFAFSSAILEPKSGFLLYQSLHFRADITILDETATFPENYSAEESNSSTVSRWRPVKCVGKFVWTIRNFSFFKEIIKNWMIASPAFRIGLAEYRLSVNEILEKGVGYLSLYLKSDVAQNVRADCLSIFGSSESSFEREFICNSCRSCWGRFGISVLNQKPGLDHMHEKSFGRFDICGEDDLYLGWRLYMKMSDFTGSEKGFLERDDMVVFCVTYHVLQEAYCPENLLSFEDKFISSFSKCDEDSGGFFWEILNLRWLKDTMKKKRIIGTPIESRILRMENQYFRLVVYPRGQSSSPSYLSLFLEIVSSRHSHDSSILLHYRLGIVNNGELRKSIIKESLRRCCKETKKLGWWEFVALAIFYDQSSEYMRKGSTTFYAAVHILKETFIEEDLTESCTELSHIEYDGKRKSFTWSVESFLSCREIVATQIVFSRFFKVAGFELRIGVFVSADSVCVNLDPSRSRELDDNFWVSFRIALVNQKDPNKSLWKKSSLCTKAWNYYNFRMMKLSDILEPDTGYIVHDMITFVCQILDYSPWFEFSEPEVLAGDEGEVASLSDLAEPLNSIDTGLSVKRYLIDTDDKVFSSCNFGEPLNSEDTEPTARRKLDVEDCEVSSSDFGKPVNSKKTEPSVKLKEEIFKFKDLISSVVCLPMNEQNNPQLLVKLKEELQLDVYTLATVLLMLHFLLDDLDKLKLLSHPSTSGIGELKDASDESLPTSENLMVVIKALQQKIDDILLDIMLECFQSTKKKPSLDSRVVSSVASVATDEALSELELHGDIEIMDFGPFNIFGEFGFDKDLQCFDLNNGTTIQTMLGHLICQLGNSARCPLVIGSAADSEAMTKLFEDLVGFIVDLLKPLSASMSVVCLGSSKGLQPDGKISCMLDKTPVSVQPYLVALLCNLVNPLERPLAARELLHQLEKMDAESLLQSSHCAATSQSHFIRNKLWEHVFYRNLMYLEETNDETIELIIRLLFKTASLCQHIPHAVRAVRAKLEQLSPAVPTCVLNLLETKIFEKGIAHGFFVDQVVTRVLERRRPKLEADALYSAKYQDEEVTDMKEETEDDHFRILIDLAETLSISDNPRVCELAREFYAVLLKLFAEENHCKKLLKDLVNHAIISSQNFQIYMDVLLFLVHGEYDIAKQVFGMMREATVLAKNDNAVLCHQLSATKGENTRKTEEWHAEISSLNKEKAVLLERLSVSEAKICQCKSEIRCEQEQFAKEKKKLTEHIEEVENQLKLFRSEQDDKIEMLFMEKKNYQDRLCSAELQLAELKRQKYTMMRAVEEKNHLAARLWNAQDEIRLLDDKLKLSALEAEIQETYSKSLQHEIWRSQEEVEKREKERQKKEEEVSLLKTYIGEMKAKLMVYQQQILYYEDLFRNMCQRGTGGFTSRP